ncbi:MAG: recombinase family protein [Acidobacteria bacterium]|nr:recombinase family protein [Acidobacteriota bacterium]
MPERRSDGAGRAPRPCRAADHRRRGRHRPPHLRAEGAGVWQDAHYRRLYRGEIVWNQSRKRNTWGQKAPKARQAHEWITVPAPHLRIVPDALWDAVQSGSATPARPISEGRTASCGGVRHAASSPSTCSPA